MNHYLYNYKYLHENLMSSDKYLFSKKFFIYLF